MSSKPIAAFRELDTVIEWFRKNHPKAIIGSKIGNFTIQEHFDKDPWIKNRNRKIRQLMNENI